MKTTKFKKYWMTLPTLAFALAPLAHADGIEQTPQLSGEYAATSVQPETVKVDSGEDFWGNESYDGSGYVWSLFGYQAPNGASENDGLLQSAGMLEFLGLSPDGSSIDTEIQIKNQAFTQILASQSDTLRVRATWSLNNCDGQQISNTTVTPNSDIQTVVNSLNAYDFSRYMKCSLTIVQGSPTCSETGNGLTCGYSNSNYGQAPQLQLLDTGDVILVGSDSATPSVYFRPAQPADATAEQNVANAVTSFTSLLKDYGNTLLMVQSASQQDRTAALTAFFAKNRDAMVGALTTINANLSKTSALTKVNVTSAINRAYSYVQYMETTIQAGPMLDDEVIIKP